MNCSEFKCRDCDAAYENINSFRTHLRRHHGRTYSEYMSQISDVRIFTCEICGFKATNLVTHIVRRHEMTVTEYKMKFDVEKVQSFSSSQIKKIHETWSHKDSVNKSKKREKLKHENEAVENGIYRIKCKLCDFEGFSLLSHIVCKHKITIDEYRRQFPDCGKLQVATLSARRNNSRSHKNSLLDLEKRQKFDEVRARSRPSMINYWTSKGFSEEEAKLKVFSHQSMASLNISEESQKEKALRQSGDSNPSSLVSIAKRNNVTLEQAHTLTPCFGRCGENHPMFGKKHTAESLEKISGAWHLTTPTYRSTPEIEIASYCLKLNPLCEFNKHIKRWNVDVVCTSLNIVVEIFGDWWHMIPARYKSSDTHYVMKKKAELIWSRDARKIQGLNELGYSVIVVWESDWRRNKTDELERIKNAFDRASNR